MGENEAVRERDSIDATRAAWASIRPDLDTEPIATMGRILRIARHLTVQSDELLAVHGLTRGEFDVLSAVRRTDAVLTASDLARLLLASNASITKRLALLERNGLVERQRGQTDGRVVTVHITAQGVRAIDEALPVQLEFERGIGSALTDVQRAGLEVGLRVLLGEIESRAENPV